MASGVPFRSTDSWRRSTANSPNRAIAPVWVVCAKAEPRELEVILAPACTVQVLPSGENVAENPPGSILQLIRTGLELFSFSSARVQPRAIDRRVPRIHTAAQNE